METRKMVLTKLFAGHQWRHRHREQTYGHGVGRKERVGCTEREIEGRKPFTNSQKVGRRVSHYIKPRKHHAEKSHL